MNNNDDQPELNRRDFLKNTSQAAFLAMMGAVELRAEDKPAGEGAPNALTQAPPVPPVRFGVIGAGIWGREVINTLGLLVNPPPEITPKAPGTPYAPVVAICDHYSPALPKANALAPKAVAYEDYKQLLENKDVEAVVVATPTHQHLQIVLDALKKGKHVYCEAPLAGSIDEAKTMALAAKESFKLVFQAGLQERSHPQRIFLHPFIRAQALGRHVLARTQWHKKDSWARSVANPVREAELNWRLQQATSTGLIGENCIHLLDAVTWFLGARPTEVTGFSSTILWGGPGRNMPDTVQAVFEMQDGGRIICDAMLCNSFDSQYEMYYGTDSAILVRDSKAWMFKEPDSAFLGWEGYARKDVFGAETGVTLVAGASKQAALGKNAVAANPFPNTPLYYALDAFTYNAGLMRDGVKDFTSNYPDSKDKELQDYLAGTLKMHPAAGWQAGLEATVLVIKANEATLARKKIALGKELFEL
jgi:predicted dehydrogenase